LCGRDLEWYVAHGLKERSVRPPRQNRDRFMYRPTLSPANPSNISADVWSDDAWDEMKLAIDRAWCMEAELAAGLHRTPASGPDS
jgi:hypothetical protein